MMTERWEYEGVLLSSIYAGDNITELTRMGEDGWELVVVDQGIAYIKRRLEAI